MNKFYKYFILFTLILLALPSTSFAQFAVPETKENISPTTGSLMAAAFETAGYAAQSQVLEHLGFMFESLGGLIYVVILLGAVISFSIYGSYQYSSWLVVGPVLFFFLINTRQVGYGAEWQWGYEDITTTEEFSVAIGAIKNNQGETVNRVSWFFDEYNKLVSDFIQQSISIVLNNNVNERIKPMARQAMLGFMFNANIQSPNLKTLIHFNQAHCSDQVEYFRQIALGKRHKAYQTSDYYKSITKSQNFKSVNMTINPSQPVYRALEDIFDTYHDLGDLSDTEEGYQFGNVYENWCVVPEEVPGAISCHQVWCWMVKGLQVEVAPLLREAEERHLPQVNDSLDDATEIEDFKKQIWKDILVKLSDPKTIPTGDTTEYNVSDGLDIIPIIIGGHLMRKEMANSGNSALLTQLGENSGYRNDPFGFDASKVSHLELEEIILRYQREQLRAAEQGKVYTVATYMPYLQGLILYVLGLTFPFFALMVLIPGQTQSFMQWLGLWFWVKLWDLGWAFVIVLDDILWSLMPNSAFYDAESDPNDAPITFYDTAFTADPAYSLGMYYTIIGVVIAAVPVVSAQLFIGSKMAVVNALMQGMNRIASNWGRAFQNSVATNSAVGLEKLRTDFALSHDHNGQASPNAQRIAGAADIAAENAKSLLAQSALAGAAFAGSVASLNPKSLASSLGKKGGEMVASAKELEGKLREAYKKGDYAGMRDQLKNANRMGEVLKGSGKDFAKVGVANGFLGTSQELLESAISLGQFSTELVGDAYKLNEMEKLARSGRTHTDLNLQALLGATRSRIGHWFGRGSETRAVSIANNTVNSAAVHIQTTLAGAYANSSKEVLDGLQSYGLQKSLLTNLKSDFQKQESKTLDDLRSLGPKG